MDGVLVVDKPVGPTSHDVVARMRRVLGEPRIGHTGTLDPAASGVLPLVIGRATRLAQFLSGAEKEYEAIVQLGAATTTGDAEGEVAGSRWSGPLPSRDAIERALDRFRGTFEQRPPAFSAKKVNGVRSYKRARGAARAAMADAPMTPDAPGAPVAPVAPLAPVRVTVHRLELLHVEADRVTLRLACSAGFYVRSLAHDLGETLGTGAHLAALRRLRSGDFAIADAMPLDAAERDPEGARQALVPFDRLLPGWEAVVLTDSGRERAARGRDLAASELESGTIPGEGRVRLLDRGGRLVGIGETVAPGVLLHPAVVFV